MTSPEIGNLPPWFHEKIPHFSGSNGPVFASNFVRFLAQTDLFSPLISHRIVLTMTFPEIGNHPLWFHEKISHFSGSNRGASQVQKSSNSRTQAEIIGDSLQCVICVGFHALALIGSS